LYENPKYYSLLKRAGLKHGGRVSRTSIIRDTKRANEQTKDLNNANDVLDIDADGVYGAETGLFAGGGGIDNMMTEMMFESYDDGGLIAPNGNPSNLTPEQYQLVRTPEFKAWFGDWENDPENASKVVDENEEPLVVYHGSISSNIQVFNKDNSKRISSGLKEFGTYFTDNKKLAEAYKNWNKLKLEEEKKIDKEINQFKEVQNNARNNRDYDYAEQQIKLLKEQKKGKIYSCFLNLKKIKSFDAKGETNIEAWNNLEVKASYKWAVNRDAIEFLKEGKFGVEKVDGIKAENIVDAYVQTEDLKKELIGTVYLVFEPQNIKLADGTNTTFDANNPDIRYADGGAVGINEYEYVLTQRPFDIGTYPLNNFIRFEDKDFQYGVLIYSKPLSIDEMERYSLSPITEIIDYDGKILDYKLGNLNLKARVKLETDKRKGYYVNLFISDDNGIIKTQPMSGVNFLMEIKNGRLILENESTVEPMNDIEITTGYFKVNSENSGFEYAKKINNYFNKWNKIKTLEDKLDFERLDVPMFGSFENETVLDQIERFEKLGFELGANEVVRNDFKKEVRKIIDKKISDREMEKRRYPKEDEEVTKKEKSFESEGSTEGKGKLYEFFTPQIVADKMLALAQHYGFKGGNVLEPATGSGRLIKNLKNTNITAFEISKDNFEILKREFPNAELYNFNFEKAFLKEPRFNTLINRKGTETWLNNAPFDLVLANPPYGKFSGLYSSYFNFKGQVEHFFILQTLYLLKKGGLGVYLIPSSFLRNGLAYNEIKKQIFEIAEFVDAYRLPSNIFEKTQIGTDILILRKK
jgi:hypothetical protein